MGFSPPRPGWRWGGLASVIRLNDDSNDGRDRARRHPRDRKGVGPGMVNERQEVLKESATLYFGSWYRRSPCFEATRRAGCTAYDVYNHMLLPGYFDDPVTEYWALLNDVTVWDVAVERTVEISGPDADRLVDSLTCRDLTECAVMQG